MTFKRRVLSALRKDELLEICRDLELEVTTRMAVDDLRDTHAKSKRASLTAIVQEGIMDDAERHASGAHYTAHDDIMRVVGPTIVGRKVRGPGLPDHLDPKDPRWFSTDCIEPPPVGA